jgi:hypothetical protein
MQKQTKGDKEFLNFMQPSVAKLIKLFLFFPDGDAK